jgi:hypothetical protein
LPNITGRHRSWQDRLRIIAPLVERNQLDGKLGKTAGEIGMLGLDDQKFVVGIEVVIECALQLLRHVEGIFDPQLRMRIVDDVQQNRCNQQFTPRRFAG